MQDECYYHVKIKENMETDKGTIKTVTREKLIKAVSFTDIEKKVNELYTGVTFDWNLHSAVISKIDEVIE